MIKGKSGGKDEKLEAKRESKYDIRTSINSLAVKKLQSLQSKPSVQTCDC
jgi:hypothetical protein